MTNADVTLDAIGNITWKQGVGSYGYHGTKKRAVVSAGSHTFGYDANGNMTSRNGWSIGYTSYNLPSLIHAGTSSSSIAYGAFRNRYKQVAMDGSGTETTIYVAGLLEKVTRPGGVVEYRHLIAGGGGPAANYTRRSNGTASTYYLHADHLGSPELVTDAAGAVVVRLSFGAYGERRDKDWDGPVGAADLSALANVSRHGFTGHEHLDAVGLIHMNGRVYEPTVGRFLSRDPFIDGVASSQGPNGYAYVHNNPLTLTDTSGFGADGAPLHHDFGDFGRLILQDWVRDLEFAQGGGAVVIDPGLPRTRWARVGGGSDRTTSFAGVTVIYGVHANSAVGGTQRNGFGIDDAATLGVGLTPAGTLADIYTAATGKDIFTGEEISGLWRFAGVIPWVSEVRKAGKAIDAARGTTTQYRAVKPAELADITATGALRNLGSAEGKYFTTSAEAAASYARQAVRGFGDPPYTLIRTEVPNSIFRGLTPATVDRGIPAWVIPNSRLPGLVPEVLDVMPLVRP